jgi:hypothetical protein
VTTAATFCCVLCRLLQPPTIECIECGSAGVAALAFEGEVLRQARQRQRGKVANVAIKGGISVGAIGAYLGAVAGGALISPLIPAVALGAFFGGATLLLVRKRNKRVTTVPLIDARTSESAVTRRGTARRLTETLTACGDGADHVLAEQAIVRGKADGIYFRRTRSARFLVEVEDGERLVVDGVLRLAGRTTRSPTKAGDDERLVVLGIEGVPVAGELELTVLRDGDAVEVTGDTTLEAVAELAFDRDAGQATVMRGRARSVVVVRHA